MKHSETKWEMLNKGEHCGRCCKKSDNVVDVPNEYMTEDMLKQNHKFVNNLMRKNRQKTLKRTYCNIKSNKSATFCNMNTLTYIAKFVTI